MVRRLSKSTDFCLHPAAALGGSTLHDLRVRHTWELYKSGAFIVNE